MQIDPNLDVWMWNSKLKDASKSFWRENKQKQCVQGNKKHPGDFSGGPIVICTSNAGGMCSIPGQGTKIPRAAWCGERKKERKKVFKKLVSTFSSVTLYSGSSSRNVFRKCSERKRILSWSPIPGQVKHEDRIIFILLRTREYYLPSCFLRKLFENALLSK